MSDQNANSVRATNEAFDFNLGEPAIPDAIPGFENYGLIDFKHVINARDLGGMPAADGKHIQKHRLIRSGELHRGNDKDFQTLVGTHKLERIVDFRTDTERNGAPDPTSKLEGVTYIADPVFSAEAAGVTHGGNPIAELKELLNTPEGPYMKVRGLYEAMVTGAEGIKAYTTFMETLLGATTGATLWHCTEGKDRTGIGALLIEYALGVPMEYIREDYLATNIFARKGFERFADNIAKLGIAQNLDADLDAFMYAYLGYLDHAINIIEMNYGTIDAYLDKELGINKNAVEDLRRLYLN